MNFHQKLSAYSLGLLTDQDLPAVDYISIWEAKTDGLDFYTASGLTKEEYIEMTEGQLREHLEQWLAETLNRGISLPLITS